MSQHKVAITRCEHFNAAHRLHNPAWSDERNQQVFGKCNNPNFHGHNYDLEVKVTGHINPDTGYVMDAKLLSDIVKREVLERFDHKNLNLDVAEFKALNPTAENISVVIYDLIKKHLSPDVELKIKLYETRRNVVEYPA